ncbi:hypothetical protein BV22DRAFT_1135388 [Leucogyrophana mollusca]|uniref:Uncharacterized protein n=1 Tax=Leucogyrophana mollusca TaxID=85980 RepID=A0ACB8AYF4_9AGAM|nr:hypothetical protein BV22DRAFT_1135388 [Leucogyrophana mollusca]
MGFILNFIHTCTSVIALQLCFGWLFIAVNKFRLVEDLSPAIDIHRFIRFLVPPPVLRTLRRSLRPNTASFGPSSGVPRKAPEEPDLTSAYTTQDIDLAQTPAGRSTLLQPRYSKVPPLQVHQTPTQHSGWGADTLSASDFSNARRHSGSTRNLTPPRSPSTTTQPDAPLRKLTASHAASLIQLRAAARNASSVDDADDPQEHGMANSQPIEDDVTFSLY